MTTLPQETFEGLRGMGNTTRWIVGLVILGAAAAVTVLAGGFLWPRPQFSGGPWFGEERVPVDSLAIDSLAADSLSAQPTPGVRPPAAPSPGTSP